MPKTTLAKQAKNYWEKRKLEDLMTLRNTRGWDKVPEVLYFVGHGLDAKNQRKEAIQCWRKAIEINPNYEDAIRTLAYELLDQSPVDAAKLFYDLIGMRKANADDYCCLGEIRIKQDRLGEARRWLDESLRLEPNNELALLAVSSLYAQVKDSSLAVDFLKKAARTQEIDLSELASDPEFEFLWDDPQFKRIVSGNGK